jgi:hypothetical protein
VLRYNTFRATKYLRSKFVEGKYLLASEASDLELELIDLLRKTVSYNLGDNVAIDDAWKVQRLSATSILIKPGEAWFKGLPFRNRFGKDELVSGSILSLGSVPVGVTIVDDPNGLGKIITFNNVSTTPTNLYRLVITAREELVTDVQDPFLKNVNITEDTGQKIRLHFKINLVPDSLQTETPIPYADENSTSVTITNYPSLGNFAAPNLVNQVTITPAASMNGELLSTNVITGSQGIDGRTVELTIRNDISLGGGNPLPVGTLAQQAFSNGFLIDSNGSKYYINAIFTDIISTQVVIRIAQEYTQPIPQIVNGSPQGALYWPVAKLNWDATSGLVHNSSVTDLREVISAESAFQDEISQKVDLKITGGGHISLTGSVLAWNGAIELINAYGPIQTIAINSVGIVDGGCLVYELNLVGGGAIAVGNLSVTTTSTGTSLTLSGSPSLSTVRVGNILNIGTQYLQITAIDDVNKILTVSVAASTMGAATIYQDSFGPSTAQLTSNSYVLATMRGGRVWVSGLELESGESGEIGDGISDQLLTYIGASSEIQSAPVYSSTNVVTQGVPLPTAISELDAAVSGVITTITSSYEEYINIVSGSPVGNQLNPVSSGTNITIPVNSRAIGSPQEFYIVGKGKLEVYLNGQHLVSGQPNGWLEVGASLSSSDQIQISQNLLVGDTLTFRIS